MLYSWKLQCHYMCHFMPLLVYMPFSREGTKNKSHFKIIIIIIFCQNSSYFLLCSQTVTDLHWIEKKKVSFFFLFGRQRAHLTELRRTTLSSQNKTIDENKTMISWDHFYIESLKLLFVGIFYQLSGSPFLIFLFFTMNCFEIEFLFSVLLSCTKTKRDIHTEMCTCSYSMI